VRARRAFVAAGVAGAVVLSGCGGAKAPAVPPPEARQPVVDLLVALRSGRYDEACRAVSGEAVGQLRDAARGAYTVHPGTEAARLREVRSVAARTASCAGTMAIVAQESQASIGVIERRARTMPLSWIGPRGGAVTLGADEDYDVERRDGRWVVTVVNALPPGP
jgi:hypothetical protein